MSRRILFVDDEPYLLDALRRLMRGMRHEWECEFAAGGAQGLEMLATAPCDLVVSDMHMPGLNGAQFLSEVMARYPETVRIVLSGHANPELVVGTIGVAHQFLAKPVGMDVLISSIQRALELQSLLTEAGIRLGIAQIGTIPSLPALASGFVEAAGSRAVDTRRLAGIAASDIGLAARILQLVNSAFFSFQGSAQGLEDALRLLGAERIRLLLDSPVALVPLDPEAYVELGAAHLWAHSLSTAMLAAELARIEHAPTRVVDETYSAGLLHDIGKIILFLRAHELYNEVMVQARSTGGASDELERARIGATHSEVGAYLLGIWGLPDAILEAVAAHHSPAEVKRTGFSPILAVHVASAMDLRYRDRAEPTGDATIDEAAIDAAGLSARLPMWMRRCAEILELGATC